MKLLQKTDLLVCLLLLILSVPALKSLTSESLYTSHDGETHTARIAQYYMALRDGQLPPRIAPTLYSGLTSPIFVYIYPLPYILGSSLHFLGLSYTAAFKVLMAASFIFSGIFFYLFSKVILENSKAAAVGALFYVWAPYRFLLIYVRGSLSEILAYTFLPLVLYSLAKFTKTRSPRAFSLVAISFGLLLLSQNLVALMSLPVILITLLVLHISKSLKIFIISSSALILGFSISSFTYLPSIFERNYVHFDEVFKNSYTSHFVTIGQLIHSPWGYGFDLPGTVNDQMSFQIGLAHLVVLAIFLIVILFLPLLNFFRIKNFFNKVSFSQSLLAVTFFLIFLVSVFLLLESKPTFYVWQQIKILGLIDLPWRFLGIATFCLSFIAAYVAKIIKINILIIFLVLAVLIANRNHLRINKVLERDDAYFDNYLQTATQYSEFTPKWRQTTSVPGGFDKDKKIEINSGQVTILSPTAKSNRISFSADVRGDQAILQVDRFYFPKTLVYVDNLKKEPFKDFNVPTGGLNSEGRDVSGLIFLTLNKGEHFVKVVSGETNLRLFADILSLGSFALALILLRYAKK